MPVSRKPCARFGIEKAEEEIRRFVVEGNTIELRSNLWGGCATETKTEFRAFEMGFDWTQSDKTKTIQGAKPDSNAWRAGVRNGQKFTAIDVSHGNSTYLVELEIEDGQGKRRIKYYPASTTDVAVAPQYKATATQCDPGTFAPLPAA